MIYAVVITGVIIWGLIVQVGKNSMNIKAIKEGAKHADRD